MPLSDARTKALSKKNSRIVSTHVRQHTCGLLSTALGHGS